MTRVRHPPWREALPTSLRGDAVEPGRGLVLHRLEPWWPREGTEEVHVDVDVQVDGRSPGALAKRGSRRWSG